MRRRLRCRRDSGVVGLDLGRPRRAGSGVLLWGGWTGVRLPAWVGWGVRRFTGLVSRIGFPSGSQRVGLEALQLRWIRGWS